MMRSMWIVLVACVLKCWAMPPDELEEFSDFITKTSQLDLNLKSAGAGFDDNDRYDGDELISEHAWEDSGKFEGDLILNDRQRRLIIENVEGLSRNGVTDITKRWPNNEVIYFIQREHFNSEQVQAIESGIEDLARASCVKFRPYIKGDRDAVVIQGSRNGCFSQVGYQGGYQVLNLSGRHPAGRGCFRHGTVIHELLHTLGFYHMQSSSDRDDYIDVLWENILQSARHNFRKYNSYAVSDFGVGYDYDSVLHYSRRAFSFNGKDTLVPKQAGAFIGQRRSLSDKDTQKLNKMYCDADSNNFEAEETTSQKPKKKKKPKDLPFEGHGIGYHQGKTVVIKLPVSKIDKLQDTIPVFDYLGKEPQTVPDNGAHLYHEVMYPYTQKSQMLEYTKPNKAEENPDDTVVIVNKETPATDEIESNNGNEERVNWESSLNANPNAEKIIENDESLVMAYGGLASKTQKVYPEYTFKVNRDYSQFYDPSDYKEYKSIKYLDDKFGKTFNSPQAVIEKPIRIEQEQYRNEEQMMINGLPRTLKEYEDTDSTYRTSLPIRKPYSSYDQTETPNYATLDYLKDRQNYSHLYSPRINDEQIKKGQHATYILNGESPSTMNEWYNKDSLKHNPSNYDTPSYTDYVTMEHKREEPANPMFTKYYEDHHTEMPKKSQPYKYYYERGVDAPKKSESYISVETPSHRYAISGEYYDESSTQAPKKSEAYELFGVPNPLVSSWYKPVYSSPKHSSESYSGGISSPEAHR